MRIAWTINSRPLVILYVYIKTTLSNKLYRTRKEYESRLRRLTRGVAHELKKGISGAGDSAFETQSERGEQSVIVIIVGLY